MFHQVLDYVLCTGRMCGIHVETVPGSCHEAWLFLPQYFRTYRMLFFLLYDTRKELGGLGGLVC